MSQRILVTGSSGLIGSEVSEYFARAGWEVHGVDNNGRAAFFGPKGDTRWNQRRLEAQVPGFRHHELDIRDRGGVLRLLDQIQPDAVVHTAAQPSHDLAARVPFDDFDTNAVGTLNVLEAMRQAVPTSPLVHMSTNKVYGDAPNELALSELETRWDYARPEDYTGIAEDFRIDRCKHCSSRLEGRGRREVQSTALLRHAHLLPARWLPDRPEPHPASSCTDFYLTIRCNVAEETHIYGYKGKQVRDNIHAEDVARFAHASSRAAHWRGLHLVAAARTRLDPGTFQLAERNPARG